MKHLIYGIHAVNSHLQIYAENVSCFYCIKGKKITKNLQFLINRAKQKNIPIKTINTIQFSQILKSYGCNDKIIHQGVGIISDAKIKIYQESELLGLLKQVKENTFILVLDCIQDPHNMGACIRTSDAVGVDFIIFTKHKSVGINPVVHKISCGASQNIRLVEVTNLVRTLQTLKKQGIWLVGLSGDVQTSLYDIDLTMPTALIVGNEGNGLRLSTRKTCDYLAQLPMYGKIESLNISVAVGISMYELRRQRNSSHPL